MVDKITVKREMDGLSFTVTIEREIDIKEENGCIVVSSFYKAYISNFTATINPNMVFRGSDITILEGNIEVKDRDPSRLYMTLIERMGSLFTGLFYLITSEYDDVINRVMKRDIQETAVQAAKIGIYCLITHNVYKDIVKTLYGATLRRLKDRYNITIDDPKSIIYKYQVPIIVYRYLKDIYGTVMLLTFSLVATSMTFQSYLDKMNLGGDNHKLYS